MKNSKEEKKIVTEIHTMNEEQIEKLELNLKKLSAKEQAVLIHRYGLEGQDRKTQKETAEILGLSESSIGRIERKAINHLKIVERHNPFDDSIKDNLNQLSNNKKR